MNKTIDNIKSEINSNELNLIHYRGRKLNKKERSAANKLTNAILRARTALYFFQDTPDPVGSLNNMLNKIARREKLIKSQFKLTGIKGHLASKWYKKNGMPKVIKQKKRNRIHVVVC